MSDPALRDRADDLAQELIPEHATKIMVDTRGGDRRVYSAEKWREHLVAALRAYAEEIRETCAKILDDRAAQMTGKRLSHLAGGIESTEGTWYRARWTEARDGAATIRARGEKG